MFSTIERAIQDIKQGKMVIVSDDETRENEGDLIMAARAVTPQKFQFLHNFARGMICVAIERDRAKALNLWPIVPDELNDEFTKCKFMVSVDYKIKNQELRIKNQDEYKTGVSFYARTRTIHALADERAQADDFTRPGHIAPLVAEKWGVLAREGHTEAAVDLCRISGINPAVAVLVEILKPNGAVARLRYLKAFASRHRLTFIHIADLADYRKCREKLVEQKTKARLPTEYGNFTIYVYQEIITGKEHVALMMGAVSRREPALVRVHSRCLTGDVFHSLRCDCEGQLKKALQLIALRGKGVIVYLNQEGRDIGLTDKIKSYALQDKGCDTVEANIMLGYKPDMRAYHIGTQILRDLSVSKMELLTNNPGKIAGLEHYGLEIVRRIPLQTAPRRENKKYLSAKRDKLGHLLH